MSSIPSTSSPTHHLAALLPSKGSNFQTTPRPTPTPGPGELLIKVHSLALNPVDHFVRDTGMSITTYPAILGSDISGTVISAGPSIPADAPKIGMRVTAFATSWWKHGAPDYGAFQEKVLVPAVNVCVLPDSISFNEGAVIPMAVGTAWAGWYAVGLRVDTKVKAEEKKGVLVWGGSGSVGSAAIQTARAMGFLVYATASVKHHDYLKRLGASKLFDYHDDDVVEKVVRAVKEDGVTINLVYIAANGALQYCLDVLKEVKGRGIAKVASATHVPPGLPTMEGVDVEFVAAPNDVKERDECTKSVFWIWLKENLRSGGYIPSPSIKVVDGGLEAIDKALEELKAGVSGVKLVLEI